VQAGTPAVPGKNAAGSGRVASVWALHRGQARRLRTALCARNAPPFPCRLVNPLSLLRLLAQRGFRAARAPISYRATGKHAHRKAFPLVQIDTCSRLLARGITNSVNSNEGSPMKTLSDFVSAYSRVLARREEEEARRQVCQPPIVVSRQVGSGGHLVAEKLAQRLGFALCDKQILDELATRAKVPRDFLEMLDERPAKALELLGASLLRGVGLTPEDYERLLKSGLKALLKLGSVVIVGRGAIFLAEPRKALRVRIVAPRELRIRNLAQRLNVSAEEAAHRLQQIEKERAEFLRRYFNAEEASAECFDIALNTECLTIDDCVELVLRTYEKLFGCPSVKEILEGPQEPKHV